jgi:hypothetical protein
VRNRVSRLTRTNHVWDSIGDGIDVFTIWAYHGAIFHMNLRASGLVQINRRAGVLPLTGHDVELVKTPRLQILAQEVDQAETHRQAEEMVIE